MPRPCKKRRVCSNPGEKCFMPKDAASIETINLTVDEYETLRLIDVEGYNQEQCAASMDVARSTVQAIYASARKKTSTALVKNCSLIVSGGEYHLCSDSNGCCKKSSCCKLK